MEKNNIIVKAVNKNLRTSPRKLADYVILLKEKKQTWL